MTALPASWRDRDDRPVAAPAVPAPDLPPFYAPIGDFQGELYRRNAFAQGTAKEVTALIDRLGLVPGDRVLDLGCGDGRHLRALARYGIGGAGVDISPALIAAARTAAEAVDAAARADDPAPGTLRFLVADVRDPALLELVRDDGPFTAAMSLCQGGFGTGPASDHAVLATLAGALTPGGRCAVTAFHTLFAVRHLAPGDAFDPVHGVHHQVSEVRGHDDTRAEFDLWSVAYTVRELAGMMEAKGLEVTHVAGVEPGRYDGDTVGLDDPELLMIARMIARRS